MTPNLKFWKQKRRSNTYDANGAAPQPNPPPRRQATDIAYDSQDVLGPQLVRQEIRAYNLKWPKLRDWLRQEFQAYEGLHIDEWQTGLNDYFVVMLPVELTQRQRDHIESLKERDNTEVSRTASRRSVTPDPQQNREGG